MKRITSLLLACVLLVGCVLSMASCSNVSESYAKKINKAADAKEHYTLDQVLEDLGEDAINLTVVGTGIVIAVKGCANYEDLEEKWENDEEVKGIVVTFLLNKAQKAEYRVVTKNDK